MKRIIELDGLRGLAALIVLVSHFFGEVPHGARLLTYGWLGVDLFFVLSGFLIGSIIFERQCEPLFFKSFYARRAARIVPVYALVCGVTLVLAHVVYGHAWSDKPYSPGVYAVFGTNVAMSFWDGGGQWLRPTWTLGVEEQFYLILPLLIAFTPKRRIMPLLITLWASATVFRAICVHAHYPMTAFSMLAGRMDLLLAGVVIAHIHREFDMSRHVTALRLIPLAALVLLIGADSYSNDRFFVIFSPTLGSVAIASYILAVVHGAPEGTRLRSPALEYVGRISYALYLVHQPVAGLLHGLLLDRTPDIDGIAPLAVTALSVLVSFGIAAASWTFIEAPVMRYARSHRFAEARYVSQGVPVE